MIQNDELRDTSIVLSAALMQRTSGDMTFYYIVGSFGALVWAKTVYIFSFTKTFGPLIKILLIMMKELAVFMTLWIVFVLFFMSIGVLIFYELPEFKNNRSALTYMINAALGNFDTSIFA